MAVSSGFARESARKFSRGQVVIAPFPFSAVEGGSIGGKLRPALVLAALEHGDVLLCQITGQPHNSPYAVRVDDLDFATGSLRGESWVRADKLFTSASQPLRAIGTLKVARVQLVISAIHKLLAS